MKNQRGGKNASKSGTYLQTAEFALGYLYGCIKADLNGFGAAHGTAIPVTLAAARLGSLLLSEAGGGVLDGAQYLSQVRGDSTEGHEVGVAETPVHVRSRHSKPPMKRVLSKKARKAISAAQKLRWAKAKKPKGIKGWWAAMTPAQRQTEMLRRRVRAEANKKAA